jgi:pantoate kinase
MTPEVKVKKKVKEALQEMGAYYAMPVGTGFGNAGVPDFLVCLQGSFIGIECKANGNKPTALQLHHMTQIRKTGGLAYVVDENNVTEVMQTLKEKFK